MTRECKGSCPVRSVFSKAAGDCWTCWNAARRKPPKAAPVSLPCVHVGEPAGPLGWHTCEHPDEPLGAITCTCKGCGPRCPGYALPVRVAPTVRHMLYHVYPLKGSRWREGVAQLLKRIHLFNGRRVLGIATSPDCEPPEAVRAAFGGAVSEHVVARNDPTLREVTTLVPMLERVETADPTHAVWYGHAKGVTRPSDSPCHRWAEILYETTLDHWPLVSDLLTKHPLAGTFKKVGRWFPESRSQWHYSGTFWWGRCDELFGRPWRTAAERRWWGAESYPSMLFRPDEAGTIFHETTSTLNLYSGDFLRKTIEPQYTAWRARQTPTATPGIVTPPAGCLGLNIGCGEFYAPGWLNTDVVTTAAIRPDVVTRPGDPLPFPQHSFGRCYLGHVLEHVAWGHLPALLAEVLRVVKPGGSVCVVGPDLWRSLARLVADPDRVGSLAFVRGVIEDDLHHQADAGRPEAGARHQWNCYEARVVRLLTAAGLLDVTPHAVAPGCLPDWPLVSRSIPWQCAATGRVP